MYWDLEPKGELYGGKINIKIGDYPKEWHEREFDNWKKYGNSAYEMLFLVPPCLVKREGKRRSFLKIDEFANHGIKIWDGTNGDLRAEYSIDLESHRLLQYESCIGLEVWSVVCLELDEFMRFKTETL